MQLAPIVLFVYNRPHLVKQTLQNLEANVLAKESDLFIYCDGPKENASKEIIENITEVRKVIREKNWCKSVTIIESKKNKGLSKSIIEGVTFIVNKFGKIIVIEDDVLLSPYFLKFINEAIDIYQNDNRVLSIGSWSYFCPPQKIKNNTYFFRFPDCKGWATYDRAWKLFENDAEVLYKNLKEKNLLDEFNGGLKYPYFSNMLHDQIAGKINSWAIRWTATAILHNKLSLFPTHTLSKDIGFGADATHESTIHDYNKDLVIYNSPIFFSHENVKENKIAINAWQKFYIANFIPKRPPAFKKIIRKLIPNQVMKIYHKL